MDAFGKKGCIGFCERCYLGLAGFKRARIFIDGCINGIQMTFLNSVFKRVIWSLSALWLKSCKFKRVPCLYFLKAV